MCFTSDNEISDSERKKWNTFILLIDLLVKFRDKDSLGVEVLQDLGKRFHLYSKVKKKKNWSKNEKQIDTKWKNRG